MILPRNRRAHRALRLALVLGAWMAPAGLHSQTIAEVQVTPETMTLGVGGKQTIFAAAYDRQGNLVPTAKFTYWSSDTSIVQVRSDGTAIGIRPGLAKVEARVQRRRASLAVLVNGNAPAADNRPPPGAVLTTDPATLVLLPGETGHLTPRAARDDGTSLAIGRVTWKSLGPAVATVDSTGAVLGVAAGRSIIQVTTSTGLMATAPVEVLVGDIAATPERLLLAVQDTATVQLRVPSQSDRQLADGVHWLSADSTIVQVSASGVVRALAPGKTEVIGSAYGQEQRVPVAVHKVADAIVISPRQSQRIVVPRNGVRKFSIIVQAADSTPIPEVTPVWTLRDSVTAMFDQVSGQLTAKAVGVTTLTAAVPGFKPVVWTIEVVPGFVRMDRERIGLAAGERGSVEATLIDDAGRAVGETSIVTWSSDHPEVATVDSNGVIQGVAPGRALVVSTAPWGQSDTVTVLVTGDLLVTSNRGGANGLYAVMRAKPDTLLPVLADRAANVDGMYSPDHTRIAFSSDRGGLGRFDVYVADADGSNARAVTSGPGNKTAPIWTPDGTRLIYTVTDSAPSSARLESIPVLGGSPREIAAGSARSTAISPDSQTIAVVALRDKDPDLYLAPIAGGTARRLTTSSERELFPQFLPNGDLVYGIERGRGKGARVVRRSPMSDRTIKLFETDLPLVALAASRDGSVLAYAVGKATDPAKGRAKFSLYLRPPTADGVPTPVPLRQDEQISSIAF